MSKLKMICKERYDPCKLTAIRLYKIYMRTLFEYGSTAMICASDATIKKWEVLQTKTLRYILGAPAGIPNEVLLKLANVPTVRNRITHLVTNWYKNVEKHNNRDILDFIKERVHACYPHDERKTPLQLIMAEIERQTQFETPETAN